MAVRVRVELGTRLAPFLRVVIPSWRFFDRIAPVPSLLYRVQPPGAPLGPWQALLPAQRRPWSALWLNPQGNLRLAYFALLERLMDDLAALERDVAGAEHLISYALVRDLVREQMPSELRATKGLRYQFKLTLETETSEAGAQDVLVSRLHDAA